MIEIETPVDLGVSFKTTHFLTGKEFK